LTQERGFMCVYIGIHICKDFVEWKLASICILVVEDLVVWSRLILWLGTFACSALAYDEDDFRV
jgi:hypothetical protein